MTTNEKFFISLELREDKLLSKIIPGNKYKFDLVIGISHEFDSDIETINYLEKSTSSWPINEIGEKREFNNKFFPHLTGECAFNTQEELETDSKQEFIDNNYVLQKRTLIDSDEVVGQITVCLKPEIANDPMLQLANQFSVSSPQTQLH